MQNRRHFIRTGSFLAAGIGCSAFGPLKRPFPCHYLLNESVNENIKIGNNVFEIAASLQDGEMNISIRDTRQNIIWAEGIYEYSLEEVRRGMTHRFSGLRSPQITSQQDKIFIRGRLGDFEIEHELIAGSSVPYITERMRISNQSGLIRCVTKFNSSFCRKIAGLDGNLAENFIHDRFQAIPFLHRADNAEDRQNEGDYSIQQLREGKGFVYQAKEFWGMSKRIPSRSFISEGWGWRHGEVTVGIFSFNRNHMIHSSVCCSPDGYLHFGGFNKEGVDLSDLERFEPSATIDLGMNRLYLITGNYTQTSYQYRNMLDEMGCRFPKHYNPPIHWNELYSDQMDNAWNDRSNRYTRENMIKEAKKAREHSCEALYLDPGWDTAFASFIWGKAWLGNCKDYIRMMREDFGLKTSLHTPLAPWGSSASVAMGPLSVDLWPTSSRRVIKIRSAPANIRGHRNLALLSGAKVSASSCIKGIQYAEIHQIKNLNDGVLGNNNSWVAEEMPAWVEVDLGQDYEIHLVILSNDTGPCGKNRGITACRVFCRASDSDKYDKVADYFGAPLTGEKAFPFSSMKARHVKIVITGSLNAEPPELDEIQIYESTATVRENDTQPEILAPAKTGPQICLGSKQYLDEAEKRLLTLCEAGVSFLMFDGTWWNGLCEDKNHDHPIPYLYEDHMKACVELARRVHARYPSVIIEMHDMLNGGHETRSTPVYYKYGLPGSYDENWGFELMWKPFENLKNRTALALYYYNLACNIPLYLHVNTGQDNIHSVILWWYASTTRHLGIGGDSPDPQVTAEHWKNMKRYVELQDFFKRGNFYGVHEEAHIHVLPEKDQCVVNIFNLSENPRPTGGSVLLSEIGLDPRKKYIADKNWIQIRNGSISINRNMNSWDADMAVIKAP